MDIRLITVEDLPAYKHIASRAFARGGPIDVKPEEFIRDDRVRLGAFESGRLQAQYTILDFHLHFGNDQRPCGGIASVACEPSARGRGYAGALIDRSLEVMRDAGQYLSLLWPFDYRFYRLYGWDWTGYDRSYSVPLQLLETSPEGEHIEPVWDGHFETLGPVYDSKVRRYNGSLVRNQKRWEYLLKPRDNREPATYVYRRDGKEEGFAILRYVEKSDRMRATEFVTLTPRAYRAFLTLFKRHSATVKKMDWSAPMDDPLWSLILNWDIKTKLTPTGMGRIVDVEAAFHALTPSPSIGGSTVIRVSDDHAPWNSGAWRVSSDGGSVRAVKTDHLPDMAMDIQSLTQAYWGVPSLLELRRAGRIDVNREDGFEFAGRLLPATPVWLADDF